LEIGKREAEGARLIVAGARRQQPQREGESGSQQAVGHLVESAVPAHRHDADVRAAAEGDGDGVGDGVDGSAARKGGQNLHPDSVCPQRRDRGAYALRRSPRLGRGVDHQQPVSRHRYAAPIATPRGGMTWEASIDTASSIRGQPR
jgi:hypothetical protein